MSSTTGDLSVPIGLADAAPIYPPRPNAFITLLTTGDFLAGAQTLLYSIKKALPKNTTDGYPPEIVVLVTPNISKEIKAALHPELFTRILEVDPISFPEDSIQAKQVVTSHVESWGNQGTLTKLHIFRLEQYSTLVYIDADCLVLKDVSHLLDLGKATAKDALLGAASDIFPPDKFNAGVLVLRPSKAIFEDMMAQSLLLTTYDGGDTGFLNAFFSDWFTNMPQTARLKFGYNAQRFLHHCTYDKQPNYWDLGVCPDLHILHFSSSPKPWDIKPPILTSSSAQGHLDEADVQAVEKVSKTSELEQLWWKWYQQSQNYVGKLKKKRLQVDKPTARSCAGGREIPVKSKKAPTESHKLVASRYRELRKEGLDAKKAMEQAQLECGQDDANNPSASSQIAAMFGITS